MKRVVVSVLAALGLLAQASAGDLSMNFLAAYYIPNLAGYQSSGFAPITYTPVEGKDAPNALRTLGSTWGGAEAKVAFSYSDSMPFMVGEGLMAGNNVKGQATLELSPVSINTVGQVSLTPIAFLVFNTGAGLGTGWTAGPFQGLALNPASNDVSSVDLTPFGGVVWRVWGAGTFQFDLAALMPGAEDGITLTFEKGALVPQIGGKPVRTAKARIERIKTAVGAEFVETTLALVQDMTYVQPDFPSCLRVDLAWA